MTLSQEDALVLAFLAGLGASPQLRPLARRQLEKRKEET